MNKVVTVGAAQPGDGELVTDGVKKEGVIYLLSSKDSEQKQQIWWRESNEDRCWTC